MINTTLKLLLSFFFCLTYSFCSAQAQQKKLDSLLKINEAYTKQDTAKISLLIKTSKAFNANKALNSALDYGKEALALAEKLDQKKYIANCLLNLGILTSTQSPPTASTNYLERARDISQGQHDPKLYGSVLFWLGDDYRKVGEFRKGLDAFLRAYELTRPLNLPKDQLQYTRMIAQAYLDVGDTEKASNYSFETLKVAEKVNDKFNIASTYNQLSNLQYILHNYNDAIAYGKKAVTIIREINNKSSESIYLSNIGLYYFHTDDLDSAANYYNKSLQVAKVSGNHGTEIKDQFGLGCIYYKQKKYQEAISILNTTLIAYRKAGDLNSVASAQIWLGCAYMYTDKFDMAEKALDEAYNLYKRQNVPTGRRDALKDYAYLYELSGNNAKALSNYKKYIELRDSIINLETRSQVAKKELQYDFDKKEGVYQLKVALAAKDSAQQHALSLQQQQQLLVQRQKLTLSDKEKSLQQIKFLAKQAELENDRKLQATSLQKKTLQAKLDKQVANAQIFKQNETIKTGTRYQLLLLGIAIVALLIASLIFYNQYKTRRLNLVILSQKKELEGINAVKDRMFGIVSHDMRAPINTLMAFNTLLEYEDLTQDDMKNYAKEIKKTLNHTSALMENLLNWSSSQMQGYKPELESHFLQQISNEAINGVSDRASQKKIVLKNAINDTVRVFADHYMTEIIMRNILSNAIKFTNEGGVIELMAEEQDNKVTFTISDTGMGMNTDQVMLFNSDNYNYSRNSTLGTEKEKGSGLGLILCKTFTSMMNGQIFVKSIYGEGTTFSVTLPQPA